MAERGFSAGARRALPGVDVGIDYSHEYDDKEICERIANRGVDAGSGVVFAAAGDSGRRALGSRHPRGLGMAGTRSLASRPAHPWVGDQALRSPRRAERELVPGGTTAGRGESSSASPRMPSRSSASAPRLRTTFAGRLLRRPPGLREGSGGEATAKLTYSLGKGSGLLKRPLGMPARGPRRSVCAMSVIMNRA